MSQELTLNVNKKKVVVTVDDPNMPLLYVLRGNLGLHGPKFGCGLGQCGACTVLLNGEALRSCLLPVAAIADASITTLEGLGEGEKLHPLQQAFIDEQAVQCGYCINGMIMQSAALLIRNPHPSKDQIQQELANNLCRCGTHIRIMRAVAKVSSSSLEVTHV